MAEPSSATITRRNFVGAGLAAAVVGFAGALRRELRSGDEAPQTKVIDQNPIRRRGTGLRALDPARASAGLTLFAPQEGDGTIYLIDLRGNVVHTWKMPYRPGLYGYLTDRGTLFYNGRIPDDTFLGKMPYKGGVALEADWNGKVLWEVHQQGHHHDGRLLKNGNVLLLCSRELPDGFDRRIVGGRPGSEAEGKIWADYVVEMTKDGRTVWEWRTWEHLDPARDVITALQDDRAEWTHGNAVMELPDGNFLVSFRNISTIVKVDRQTGECRLEAWRPAVEWPARAHTIAQWQHPHL